MPAPIITDLTDAYRAAENSVGSLGKQLAALDTKAIPVPITIIITRETLTRLLEESNILHELRELRRQTESHDGLAQYHLREHVLRQLSQIQLPDWFTHQLLDSYHRLLQRGFVRIRHGRVDAKMDTTRFEHIQGDANLIQSLKHFWSKMVEYELIKQPSIQADTLAPNSIILQSQSQAEASGVAITMHPETGMRQHFHIRAIWGCPDPTLMELEADTYVIDNRTHHVIMRSVSTQTRYYRRTQDDKESIAIPAQHQNKPILPDELCAELSRILLRIKRQNLHHAEVTWELTPSGYEITGYEQYHEQSPQQKSGKAYVPTTKIYITGGNPYKTQLDPLHLADGMGVMRSEYTYFAFGIHPLAALKTRQREVLQQKLVSAIKTFKGLVHNKPVLYRSLFATTKDLHHLQFGETEEPTEPNPFMGWRGGLRLRHQPQFLQFELEMISEALHQTDTTLGYIVPFMRHPQELDTVLSTITDAGLQRYKHFQTWWQLNTPENMLNFASYPTHNLDGIVIHQRTIQALLQGVDPTNSEITDRYSSDPDVFIRLLEQLMQEVKQQEQLRASKQPLQILLYLEDYNRDLVSAAVKLRCDGIVIKPIALAIAHETVAEYEQTQLLHT